MSTGPSPRTLNGTQHSCGSVAILEHELSELRLLLERYAGVLLNCPSDTLLTRVSDYLESHHLNSAADLLEQLRSSDPQCESLLDTLLNGETGFYRHPASFDLFARKALPELERRKSADSPRTSSTRSSRCRAACTARPAAASASW